MALTFGDLTDATNQARRETPVIVVDQNGTQYTVEDCQVEITPDGAVGDVKLTITPSAP
jgi:glucose-6-phosphate dehydrogenase assembly protein OpcA